MADIYEQERVWADQFDGQLRKILSEHLWHRVIGKATLEADQTKGYDYITADGVRIAARVRRIEIWDHYPWQFILRNHRGAEQKRYLELKAKLKDHLTLFGYEKADWERINNHPTEASKLKLNCVEYLIYGFGGDGELKHWFIINLDVWRYHLQEPRFKQLDALECFGSKADRDDAFVWFDLRGYPPTILHASSIPIPFKREDMRGQRLVT